MRRRLGPRALVNLNQLPDRTSEMWIDDGVPGPVGQRRHRYLPTFILPGLSSLHIDFTASKT